LDLKLTFEKLSNSTLRERIAEKIREAILTGDLREGEKLVERSLATQFETSLTAVREALIQLETEGFVTKIPNSATHVTRLSISAAEKIHTVRKLLEAFAVEETARLATQQEIEELEQAFLELLDIARANKSQKFILKDLALHEKIWRFCGNEYVAAALRRTVYPFFAFSAIRALSCTPFDLLQDANSHLPLIDAIKAKDPRAAREAFLVALEGWLSSMRNSVFAERSRTSKPESELSAADFG
jgi:DNA-binding GntR family transcriptional regulator